MLSKARAYPQMAKARGEWCIDARANASLRSPTTANMIKLRFPKGCLRVELRPREPERLVTAKVRTIGIHRFQPACRQL